MARLFLKIFLPLITLMVAVTAFLFYTQNKNDRIVIESGERETIELNLNLITGELDSVVADLMILSENQHLQKFLETGRREYLRDLEKDFVSLSRRTELYDQIRFLNDRGMEIIRANFNSGSPGIVAEDHLQDKSRRYYFTDTFGLETGEVFVSPLDLNTEKGKLEMPLKPMIRFGTPVFHKSGQKRGIVLLNYFGARLLEKITCLTEELSSQIALLNSEGFWLKGFDPGDEWGFMYEDRKDRIFGKSFPEAWGKITRSESGQFYTPKGLFAFATVYPLKESQISSTGSFQVYKPSTSMLAGKSFHWKIVTWVSREALNFRYWKILWVFLVFAAPVNILIAIGSWFVARSTLQRKNAERALVKSHNDLEVRVKERTAELNSVNNLLRKEAEERRRSEERVKHLNDVLRAVRYINQLIVTETDRDQLLQGACTNLVETRGYYNVFIVLIGESGELMTAAEAGLGEDFLRLCEQLKRGEPTHCVRMALGQSGVTIIEDPFTTCTDCPLSHAYRGRGGMAIRIEHSGKVFGLLTVSTSREFIFDEEERSLLQELALDIGFALNSMMELEKRKQAETERRNLEDRLRQAQKMEAIGTLAGGIAHDFNNILSAIIGYTELSKLKLPKDSVVLNDLDEVFKAGNRAKDLVAQILTFSRQSRQEYMPILIHPIVKESLKLLRASIPATIEIRKNIVECGTVMSDATQIHQLIMNLCTNAYHAMEENGGVMEVSLSEVYADSSDAINHEDLPSGPYACLTVSDTGKGIEPEIMERIFEPYFTTKEKGKGTGMGLSVVLGIVKNHRGTIDVQSEPSRGSTFRVYLPLVFKKAEPEKDDRKPIPTGTERILLVDDELPIVNLGKELLNRLGYEVTTETSGPVALEIFRSQPSKFDLVCTDLNMPGMKGTDLAKEVMKIRADIPVILCTGYSESVIEESVKKNGIKAFIMKPLVIRELATVIRKVFDGQ